MQYVYGKLINGELEYYKPVNGGLRIEVVKRGRKYVNILLNPTEAQMNEAGWYRVITVPEDGEDAQIGNVIYHYTGVPVLEEMEYADQYNEGQGGN